MAKKKYSINWDDDTAVSFEVNGVEYKNLEDVPNDADRLKLEAMLDSAEDTEFEAEVNAEIAKAKKELESISSFPVEKVVLGVFTGVAVLMLLIAGIASFSNVAKINREETAPGRVTDMTVKLEYDPLDFFTRFLSLLRRARRLLSVHGTHLPSRCMRRCAV